MAFALLTFASIVVGGVGWEQYVCTPTEQPTFTYRQREFFQCDRECRYHFGFFDRNIVGYRRAFNGIWHQWGKGCCCFSRTNTTSMELLNGGKLINRTSKKTFDEADTWSGTATTGFDTPWVCAETRSGAHSTVTRSDAVELGYRIIHCGKCAVCSALLDVMTLSTSRHWITYAMTKVSTKFAAPWGHKNLSLLQEDLFQLKMNFSLAPDHELDVEPACMNCWTDNIMCDAVNCKKRCWTKFFNPTPTENCLECDETFCGPEFIKCAGANRRSTGIVSDISRTAREQCTVGYFYNVSDDALPTLPQPSDKEINNICWDNRVGKEEVV